MFGKLNPNGAGRMDNRWNRKLNAGIQWFPDISCFLFSFYSRNPLLDAELVIPCGHTFCGFCVNIFKSENSGKQIKCEKCRDPVKAFCKNHLANNFLSMVDGQCKWCQGTFPLHSARDHIELCQEIEISCKQCRIAVKRKDRDAHKATCLMADVVCGCGIVFRRANEESHKETTCCLTEVPCPLHCGKNVKRWVQSLSCSIFENTTHNTKNSKILVYLQNRDASAW